MPPSRISTRIVVFAEEFLRDSGRFLLFLVILEAAFLASLLGAFLFFSVLVSPEASISTALKTGGPTAVEVVRSFSDRQWLLVASLWVYAFLMGAAALWVYQQTLDKIGDLRRWLWTRKYR